MSNVEVRVLCHQLEDEVKLISSTTDDIISLEVEHSAGVDGLRAVNLARLENVQQFVIALTSAMMADAPADPAQDGAGDQGDGGGGQSK